MENLKKYRRDLHQIPELGFKLYKTQEYIINVLTNLGYQPKKIVDTGVLVHIDLGKAKTIAFRSDMDALPIKEACDIDFKSKNEGCMHACGHDAHMSMLLTLAEELRKDSSFLTTNVVLIFQPAEEGPGGAKPICDAGILKEYKVDEIYGIHVGPYFPEGIIASRKGILLGSVKDTNVTIKGKSAHIGKPEDGINPIDIACEFIINTKQKVKATLKNKYIYDFAIFNSGTATNVLPDSANFRGSVRTFAEEDSSIIDKILDDEKKALETKYKTTIEIKSEGFYPVVHNDEALFDKFKETLSKDFKLMELPEPITFAEDFAFYQQQVPGVFFMIGTQNEAKGFVNPLHSNNFNLDEDALVIGVKAYLAILKNQK